MKMTDTYATRLDMTTMTLNIIDFKFLILHKNEAPCSGKGNLDRVDEDDRHVCATRLDITDRPACRRDV